MQIIVVRHGQTEENAKRILMGHTPGKLSKLGIRQAKALALKLKSMKIDLIISSDLKRASDTTAEIIRYHKVPVVYTSELREQNYGVFSGRPLKELLDAEIANGVKAVDFRPARGESFADVKRRIAKFMKKLSRQYKNSTILISAHAGIAQSLMSIYMGIPLDEMLKTNPKNTGFLILELSGGKIKFINYWKKLFYEFCCAYRLGAVQVFFILFL